MSIYDEPQIPPELIAKLQDPKEMQKALGNPDMNIINATIRNDKLIPPGTSIADPNGVKGQEAVAEAKRIENPTPPPAEDPNKSKGPWGTQFDVQGLADWMKGARNQDVNEGMDFGSKFYGAGNPAMKEILDARRARALGLNGAEIQALRERASSGINAEMATGLRQQRAISAANGLRGGAAVGANLPILARANASRAGAERDIAIEDMKRRGEELNRYEGSVSNERSGLLGTAFGFAGLGAGERSAALQYGLGADQVAANAAAAGYEPDFGGDQWDFKKAMEKWKDGGFAPGEDPLASWTHKNIFDKGDIGIDDNPLKPQNYIPGLKRDK